MKTKLLVFVVLMVGALQGKGETILPDTISFWHVYLNDKVIHQFNEVEPQDSIVELNLNNIHDADTLKLLYFQDGDCIPCYFALLVVGTKEDTIYYKEQKHWFADQLIEIPAATIRKAYISSKIKTIKFYRVEMEDNETLKRYLFTIKWKE